MKTNLRIALVSSVIGAASVFYFSNAQGKSINAVHGVVGVESVLRAKLPAQSAYQARSIAKALVTESAKLNLDPAFVLSVIQAESRFRPVVRSGAGAVGLMQILPSTAKFVAKRMGFHGYKTAKDLENPVVNVILGMNYLSMLREQFRDSTQMMAAYNMGPAKYSKLKARHKNFGLGKSKKYVNEIHNEVESFRKQVSVASL